ncbi:hypothetical protein HYH03_003904 [Edaphochlamys debaryana]|uniref:protein-L-isoaspartate(D-aspartate) O-methyltransferase n=1 Tax=Edaphochlamys debaryana TaxID=47281 RepID=A0A836C2L2_9CHLO|nr:hypothetical protein HYH03_003904 [Edaphochlamys debaryana]|eukprot:KAG2498146.1 hypothetical protein HYH03_003904 [Edaphochlamys debaryana]
MHTEAFPFGLGTSEGGGGHKPSAAMAGLVNHLKQRGALRSPEVARIMTSVDRAAFLGMGYTGAVAYEDHPLPIGFGQTISAPHMHATALELLRAHLKPGARVLDVGSGSGYLTACLGLMVQPGGKVLGVEVVAPLADRSVGALRGVVPELMQDGTIRIESGNVLAGLLAAEEPFDAIHVGAAADPLPQELVAKLAPGGRMVVPVGPAGGAQALYVVDKDGPQGHAAKPGRGHGQGWDDLEPYGGEAHAGMAGSWPEGVHVTRLMDVGYVPLVRNR